MTRPVEPFIEVQGLSHVYLRGTPLETPSLRDVDFEVRLGEAVGIVGPTGSGKSTLLQHLNGLLRPQRGRVVVAGMSLSDPNTDLRRVRQRVGLLFQSPEDQLFERFAGDDVAFAPRNMGLPPDQVRERVRQAMESVGLAFALKDRPTAQLSQGQRRRLALAGVLAMDPQVLVLDEPTAGLDPHGRRELLATLRLWAEAEEHALVLATHNMEDVVELCTLVYVLAQGQVVDKGTVQDVFSHRELLSRHGLAAPAAAEVMHLLQQRGFQVSTQILTVAEASCEIVRQLSA
jgi:energy-coupling factor transport system ATP-binding protein